MIFNLNKFYLEFPNKVENILKKFPDFLTQTGVNKYLDKYKTLFFEHNNLAFILKDLNNKFYIIIFENENLYIQSKKTNKSLACLMNCFNFYNKKSILNIWI